MLGCVKRPAVQTYPGLAYFSPPELVLAVLIKEVELRIYGICALAPLHPVVGESEVLLVMYSRNRPLVKRGSNTDTTLDPPLQNRPFDGIRVHHPASEETEVTVLDASPRGVGRLVLPLMELKLYRHIVIEDNRTFSGIGNLFQFLKEKPVRASHPLDLYGLGIVIEMT